MNTNLDPARRNPVDRILDGARRIDTEYCWPAAQAADVARALGELNQAILGYDWWGFDMGPMPRIVDVSDFKTVLNEPWDKVVERGVRRAVEELETTAPIAPWVNFTFIAEHEKHLAELSPADVLRLEGHKPAE